MTVATQAPETVHSSITVHLPENYTLRSWARRSSICPNFHLRATARGLLGRITALERLRRPQQAGGQHMDGL
eukprot:672518-Pyramimonas_sp.AAC.1